MMSDQNEFKDSTNFVILPLYSSSASGKRLPERSGLNQWNAGGRERKPGESYVPVPRTVHKLMPGFFPPRDVKFELKLPNNQTVIAKICQSGGKALMSSPNDHLNYWIFELIDESVATYVNRFNKKLPYSYSDLEKIGFDSLKVTKKADGYRLEPSAISSYEAWSKSFSSRES